jgi:hypothetical protein
MSIDLWSRSSALRRRHENELTRAAASVQSAEGLDIVLSARVSRHYVKALCPLHL